MAEEPSTMPAEEAAPATAPPAAEAATEAAAGEAAPTDRVQPGDVMGSEASLPAEEVAPAAVPAAEAATTEEVKPVDAEPPVVEAVAKEARPYEVSRDVDGTLRRIDPETGDVELYTSIEGILKAVPSMNWDLAAAWSRLPILRAHLFIDRGSYERGGVARPYASKEGKGFVVFEGGFDTSGVCVTDPPYFKLDGSDGSVDADDMDAIQRKREIHEKRRKLEQRWAAKGATEMVLQKIKQADAHRLHRKAQGEEYHYRKGWVSTLAAQASPRSPRAARPIMPPLR
ncbi:hypothetical protein AK812_SmicGene24272 [Symbiodinium microadriaticum]|uniref:Uncharacterized protein n=1 Tax=Symbiodinium microadriaticum TaxID=2951 RepID=A0A1Q9DF79_SYMMI|nr:hypothetical protein AK812_SmicGene24272 [Symbiodinium microadriaticum]